MSEGQQSKPIRLVVAGYTGFDNLGDELIAASLIQQLSIVSETLSQPLIITVLSENPHQTVDWLTPYASESLTIRAIHRKNVVAIVSELFGSQGFLCGGGGLLQDVTGLASPLYYGGLMGLARWLGCRVLSWGQGLGPLTTPLGRWLTKLGLQHCHSIVVRDDNSAHLVRTIANCAPRQTTDVVWGLQSISKQSGTLEKAPNTTRLGFSCRPFEGWPIEKLVAVVSQHCQTIRKTTDQSIELVLLPAQPNQDVELLRTIGEELTKTLPDFSVREIQADQVTAVIPTCDSIIAMRYHVVLLAALAGIPTIGLVYSPKVHALCKSVGIPAVLPESSFADFPKPSVANSDCIHQQQQSAQGNTDSLLAWVAHPAAG